jgi:[acyl-carrier-protein] S-malonyltransferase
MMAPAAQQFQEILESVVFNDTNIPVISNVDPVPASKGTELKDRLMRQMTGSVRWREIMLQLPKEDVSEVVEVGPGKVLTGLVKRTCPDIALKNVASLADIG